MSHQDRGQGNAASGRIPSLDGLRGLSIWFVMLSHISNHFADVSKYGHFWHSLLSNFAYLGVTVFFVISGYLITYLLLKEHSRFSTIRLSHFYTRRALRILPAFLVYTGIILAFGNATIRQTVYALTFSTSYFFDKAYLPLQHLWSLSVEEQFYFLWPLLLVCGLLTARRACWAVLVLCPIIRLSLKHAGFQPNHAAIAIMDYIAAGCLLAFYQERMRLFVRRYLVSNFAFLALCIGTLVLAQAAYHSDLVAIWGAVPCSISLVIAAAIERKDRILNHGPLVWSGLISYSLYLWQQPFILLDRSLTYLWVCFPMAFLLAYASYRLIEQPILNAWRLPDHYGARDARKGATDLASQVESRALETKQHAKRRVLLINLGKVTGGVEVYLTRLAQILAPTIDLYCVCISPETASDLRRLGVRVTLLPQIGKWTKPAGFVFTFLLLPYLVFRHQLDCVQVNGFLEAVFLLQARLLGRVAIYTRHGPFEDDLYDWFRQPRFYFPRCAARLFARAASVLVCVSHNTQQSLDGNLKAKSVVIPHWLPTDQYGRSQTSTLNRPTRVLCVSRLEQYKGVQLVIEAVRDLPEVELWIVGDGSYRESLEQQAAGRNVRFCGFQHDPSPFFLASDIFVMPSFGPEGSALVALEAMAHSMPCLLSDLGTNQEISDSGAAALHFRCGDIVDLRMKLESLIENPQMRRRYAQAGFARVQSVYHPAAATEAYSQLIASSHPFEGARA